MSGMDYIYNCIKKKIDKDDLVTFITAFVIGMLCHGFAYTGHYPTYGGLNMFIKKGSAFAKETRWLSAIIVAFDGKVTMPLLIGIVASIFWALAVLFVIKILNIRSRLSKLLICCSFVTFPVIASMNCFLYMAHLFAIACFLAVMGAYLWYKNAEVFDIRRGIVAVLCLTGCLSMYQPTLSVALVLIFISVGFEFAKNDSLKKVWMRVLEALIYVIASMALWMLNDAVCHRVLHIESATSILAISPESILNGIMQCYIQAYRFLFVTSFFTRTGGKVGLCLILLTIVVGTVYGLYNIRKKEAFAIRVLMILALFLLSPLATGYTFIALPDTSIVNRLFLSYILLLPFAVAIVEGITDVKSTEDVPSGFVSCICILVSVVTFGMSILFAEVDNTAYMSAFIAYEKEYSLAVRLVDRIESNPDYEMGMPVMILVGSEYAYKNNVVESPLDVFIPNMEQRGNVIMHNLTGITNFINEYIQTDMNLEWHMLDEESVDTLGIWPDSDCTKVIDGVMYLRLS